MPGVRASNLHAALKRVQRWVEEGGRGKVRESDWEAWAWAKEEVGHLFAPETGFVETEDE